MRHVWFRMILAVIWLASAVFCGRFGNVTMMIVYAVLGVVFLYSAYDVWKKNRKRGR